MKSVPARRGPFQKRPHYSLHEIEQLCGDALRSAGLFPSEPGPVRIERFIEKRFGISPAYDDLPLGVLGFTKFGSHGVEAVVVAKEFEDTDESQAAERRLRTTLAHEAGHGLMHAHLFALGERPASLFGDSAGPEILCRDVDGVGSGGHGYDGRWWEFQANKAIGALLLPQKLARAAVRPFLEQQGLLAEDVLPDAKREGAINALSDIFDVNPVVARYRLVDLFGTKKSPQLSL
jgi:hypothetical protein